MPSDYRSKLILLILVASLFRLLTAGAVELGNDEVYYWTYSQRLQWNYFDHPPLVGVWIRAFTANLLLEGYEWAVRLGSIVSAALCTVLIYATAARLRNEKAGWYAACLYTTSLYSSIIGGLFILPDSPQLLFWCASLYLLGRIADAPRSWSLWLLFGVAAGLCIMSKIHGIFLWLGLGLWILLKKRPYLKLPQLYMAATLTAVIASPILFWNLANDFATYRFHSERVEVRGLAIDPASFAREVFGQVFYNNPFNVAILVAAFRAWKRRRLRPLEPLLLYALIGLPMIFLLIGISLFRTTFPHWSGPGYVSLLPLGGVYLSTLQKRHMPRRLKGAFITIGSILLLGLGLIHFFPGTLGSKKEERLGHGDFTLDLYGWTDAGKAFARLYKAEEAAGAMPPGAPLVSHKWFPAAHLDYYFCRPLGIELIGLGVPLDLHHYSWTNSWRAPRTSVQKAWCVVPSNLTYNAQETFGPYYHRIDSVTTIENRRVGNRVRYFTVYRLQGWKGLPIPQER